MWNEFILHCINCKKSRNGASRCQHLTETNSVWQSVICASCCCFCFDQRDCPPNEMWPNDLVLVNHSWLHVFFVQRGRHNAFIWCIFNNKNAQKTQTISYFFLPYSFKDHSHKRDAILIETLFWKLIQMNCIDFGIIGIVMQRKSIQMTLASLAIALMVGRWHPTHSW